MDNILSKIIHFNEKWTTYYPNLFYLMNGMCKSIWQNICIKNVSWHIVAISCETDNRIQAVTLVSMNIQPHLMVSENTQQVKKYKIW